MKDKISMTNVSFDYLRHSSDFLNIILNNISSCILLLDKKMELQAFNEPLISIFSARKGEDLLYVRCGEAIGCAYQVDEMKECGKTSQCANCSIRESALLSYFEKKPIYRDNFSREFYMHNGKKVMKHLQFSTRCFEFQNDSYIILIINDITELVETKQKLKEKNEHIKAIQARH
ncbi:hypothetical protein ACUNWD_00895 [Sunxiuqinia sp. A32]|uniref:hypothetical protein n=1 Tax=Sunxiuqinia sp. A32 TaxID=3461496 RepID=UPI0040451BBC